jgi:hypothetical protein
LRAAKRGDEDVTQQEPENERHPRSEDFRSSPERTHQHQAQRDEPEVETNAEDGQEAKGDQGKD